LRGERAGGAPVEGSDAACVNCHRRSGLGASEGRGFIPPITGQFLFHQQSGDREDRNLPYVEGALHEIAYALDTLKADGIALLTSYGDKWLGDPAFTPVMEELNRRGAIVYTHPTTANCCGNLIPDVPESIIEWGTDTTRTIASLVFSGAAARFRDVKWIFSHGGGTLPFLTERFVRLPQINKSLAARVPNGVEAELKRFYYDTAQAAHPYALASLTRLIPVSQIVFGTDYPYRTASDHVKGLADFGFSARDLLAIDRDNAVRLMPQLKA